MFNDDIFKRIYGDFFFDVNQKISFDKSENIAKDGPFNIYAKNIIEMTVTYNPKIIGFYLNPEIYYFIQASKKWENMVKFKISTKGSSGRKRRRRRFNKKSSNKSRNSIIKGRNF